MVFFAAMGAVSLISFDANSGSEAWMTPVLSLPLILFACGNALRGERWSADQKLQSLFR
nr:hypothetical protein REQ54_03855 [Rhizobium sp. Q54]